MLLLTSSWLDWAWNSASLELKPQTVTYASQQHPTHCSHCSQLLKVLPKGVSLMQVAHSRCALGLLLLIWRLHLMILPASVHHRMFWKERVTVCLISGFSGVLRQWATRKKFEVLLKQALLQVCSLASPFNIDPYVTSMVLTLFPQNCTWHLIWQCQHSQWFFNTFDSISP